MLCPHCLQEGDLTPALDPEQGKVLRCSNPLCDYPNIPLLYGEDYASHPPSLVCIVGLSGHGKTVYIESLLHELQQLGAKWTETHFYFTWLDEVQMRNASTRLRALRNGQMPKGTKTVFMQPQVLRLGNIPAVGGSQLIIFDTGGEAFLDSATLSDAAKYVRHTSTIIWLLSLKKGDPYDSPDDVNQMMTVYLQTMSRLGGRTQDQTLILALTKGDELLDRPDLPKAARGALQHPDLTPSTGVWNLLERSSDALETWLGSDKCGYHNLVNLVKSRFKQVRYCLVSAQGGPLPDQSDKPFHLQPKGVLAPLLWLWRMQRTLLWVEREGETLLHLDLAEAVAQSPGGVVKLEEGTYRLNKPLSIRTPIQLVGVGADKTIIEVTAPSYGIGVAIPRGTATFKGLSIRRVGQQAGDLIRHLQGSLELQDCTVSGGLAGTVEDRTVKGTGLMVNRHAKAKLVNSSFKGNQANGVLLLDQSSAHLQDCTFEANKEAGLYIRTKGTVKVVHCVARTNQTGILVEMLQQGRIEDCLLEHNGGSGIVVTGNTSPSLEIVSNKSQQNRRDGFLARGTSAALFQGNLAANNARNGFSITEQSTATVRENSLTQNEKNGLRVADTASPVLEANLAMDNTECGLLLEGTASGAVQRNILRHNQGDGIRLEGTGEPILLDNECNNNGGFGIAIATEEARVTLESKQNQVENNRKGPILDVRTKKGAGWWNRPG